MSEIHTNQLEVHQRPRPGEREFEQLRAAPATSSLHIGHIAGLAGRNSFYSQANSSVRAATLQRTQEIHGNRAARRVVSRATDGADTQGAPRAVQSTRRSPVPVPVQRQGEGNLFASLPGFLNNAMRTVGSVATAGASRLQEMMPTRSHSSIPLEGRLRGVGYSSLTVGLTPFATGEGVLPADEDPLLQQGEDFGEGLGEGLWGLAEGGYHMIRHPIQTVEGIGHMVGNIPAPWDSDQSRDEKVKYWKAVGNAFIDPYRKDIESGHPSRAVGRAVPDVLTMLFGGEELEAEKALEKTGEAGRAGELAETSKVAEGADAARAGDIGDAGGVGAKSAPKTVEEAAGKEGAGASGAAEKIEGKETKIGETDPEAAKAEAKAQARAALEADRVKSFEKFTGEKSISLAEAPKEMTVPKELTQGMENAWGRSVRDMERDAAGQVSKEHGGILVQNKDGSFQWKGGKPGTKDAFYPNWEAVGKDQKLIGSGHTHPYSKVEGGHTNMSMSGEDIASMVDTPEKMQIVQSGKGQFVSGRTEEFDARLKGLSKAEKQELKKEIIETYNKIYKETKGTNEMRSKAAAQATHSKYGLAYYEGQGGLLMRK